MTARLPKGNECECTLCGCFFTSESAFDKHFSRPNRREPTQHVHPEAVGLVQHERKGGLTWGFPSDDSRWAS